MFSAGLKYFYYWDCSLHAHHSLPCHHWPGPLHSPKSHLPLTTDTLMAHYSQIQPHSFIPQSERPSSLQWLFNSKHSESFPNSLPQNIASNFAKWSTARFFHNHYYSGLPDGRSSHSAIPKFLIPDKSPSAWAVNYSWIYYVILVILFWFSLSGGSTSETEFQRFPPSTSNVQTSSIF